MGPARSRSDRRRPDGQDPAVEHASGQHATPRERHSGNSDRAAESSRSVYRPATSTQSRSQRATNHSASDAGVDPDPDRTDRALRAQPGQGGIGAVQGLGHVLVRVVDQRDVRPGPAAAAAGCLPATAARRRHYSRVPVSARGCRRTVRPRPRSRDRSWAPAAALPWWTRRTRRADAQPGKRRSAARTAPPRSAARCRRRGSPHTAGGLERGGGRIVADRRVQPADGGTAEDQRALGHHGPTGDEYCQAGPDEEGELSEGLGPHLGGHTGASGAR